MEGSIALNRTTTHKNELGEIAFAKFFLFIALSMAGNLLFEMNMAYCYQIL